MAQQPTWVYARRKGWSMPTRPRSGKMREGSLRSVLINENM